MLGTTMHIADYIARWRFDALCRGDGFVQSSIIGTPGREAVIRHQAADF